MRGTTSGEKYHMAYTLERGVFRCWGEVLTLADRALHTDKFSVYSARASDQDSKCEECKRTSQPKRIEGGDGSERLLCLECLYDMAQSRNRLKLPDCPDCCEHLRDAVTVPQD